MSSLLLSHVDLKTVVMRVGIDRLMDQLTERLTGALADFDAERTEIPVRAGFHYEKPATGLIEWMPLLERHSSVLMKVVGYHPESPGARRLPTILSNLSKYDPATGHLVALVDGTFLTAMRTGAASAVASRVLARPGSSTLGLIGCGAQAVTQLHAIGRAFPLTAVLIHDVDPVAVQSFGTRVGVFLPPAVTIGAMPPNDIVRQADILCVATSVGIGEGPVFAHVETKPWLHVNAVGSDFPGKIELPRSLLLESFVCPDTLDQARREGECQQLLIDQIGDDLVTLAKRSPDFAPRQHSRTVFDSTGWALEDQVAMDLLLEWAAHYGVGSQVQIEHTSGDPRDPYEFLSDRVEGDTLSPPGDAA